MSDLRIVITALRAHRFNYTDEHDLHRGIDAALTAADVEYATEVRLSARDRIDYVIGRLGVEVKVKGTTDALRRQVTRYTEHDAIDEVLVITTLRRHAHQLPALINGKNVWTIHLGGLS